MTTYTDEENQWNTATRGGYAHKGIRIELAWEPNYGSISDNYTPDEISAFELFRLWVPKVKKEHGDIVPIYWFVAGGSVFEAAPLCAASREIDEKIGRDKREDFASFYSRPLNTVTGEPINWARVPVAVGRWAPGEPMVVKSDFISTATGWVPAPLQPSVSLEFLIDCAQMEMQREGADVD